MSAAVIVFAKAPVAGEAKTRLIPALGADGAARLAHRLLTHAMRQVLALPIEHRELCVAPHPQHPAWRDVLQQVRPQPQDTIALHVTAQGEGDLGQRMHRALSRALATHDRAVLIGTDAPGLDTTTLRAALHTLCTHDAVFVPALDGGYALVGLTRPAPDLFVDMIWSTPQVMQHTRERAARAGLHWAELPAVADIDEPADLIHLPPSLALET